MPARKSIYVESSILSFLCADPSTVQRTIEKQRDTLIWWNSHRHHYDLYASNEVILEISRGSPRFVQRRLEKAAELQVIDRVVQDLDCAEQLIAKKLIPSTARTDAVHLAIAVRTKMDILLTWNLKHLANPEVLPLVYNYLTIAGRHLPSVTTPAALKESQ